MSLNQNGIGERFKELRNKKRLTQKALATALEVSVNTVKYYENNRSDKMVHNLKILTAASFKFGCSLDFLILGERSKLAQDLQKITNRLDIPAERLDDFYNLIACVGNNSQQQFDASKPDNFKRVYNYLIVRKNIAQIRNGLHLTQEAIAKKLCISPAAQASRETRCKNFLMEDVSAYVELAEYSFDDLVLGYDRDLPHPLQKTFSGLLGKQQRELLQHFDQLSDCLRPLLLVQRNAGNM